MAAQRPEQPDVEVADERTLLLGWLAFHRGALAAKCAGLSAEQMVSRPVPSRLTLTGLVRHLTEMERVYLNQPLTGAPIELLYCTDDDPDGDIESVHPDRVDADLARWAEECRRSDEALARFPSFDVVRPGGRATVRWLVQKVVGEYARHNGHADLIREAIDGTVGE